MAVAQRSARDSQTKIRRDDFPFKTGLTAFLLLLVILILLALFMLLSMVHSTPGIEHYIS